MNDRLRLQQLCATIASLTQEGDSFGLSLGSLVALKRLAQSKLDASNDDEPQSIKDLRKRLAMATYIPSEHPHTDSQVEAFKQGLKDRLEGRPMTAFGDARDDDEHLTDSYCCGYDPYDELGLTIPEFRDYNTHQIAQYLRETGITLPPDLPRTSCEFMPAVGYDATADLLILNLLNGISETKPGFDESLAAIRHALHQGQELSKAAQTALSGIEPLGAMAQPPA